MGPSLIRYDDVVESLLAFQEKQQSFSCSRDGEAVHDLDLLPVERGLVLQKESLRFGARNGDVRLRCVGEFLGDSYDLCCAKFGVAKLGKICKQFARRICGEGGARDMETPVNCRR